MIDPASVLMKTSATLPSVTHIPSIVPDLPTYETATETGYRTLWVVTIIMALSSAGFTALSWNVPLGKRLYHVVTALITIFAALSYFGMATKHGVNLHYIKAVEQHKHVPDTYHETYRQVYWARYVDWSLTTPLLLLDLALLAGLSGGHIFIAIVADVIMVVTGLFAAYGSESNPQKWGWYAIACFAYLVVVWHLVVNGRNAVTAKGNNLGSFYASISGYTILLWTAYPIIWGVADGARILSVDQEIIAYAILDVLAKPVFGAWLLLTHARLPESNVELTGWWVTGVSSEGRLRLDDDEGA